MRCSQCGQTSRPRLSLVRVAVRASSSGLSSAPSHLGGIVMARLHILTAVALTGLVLTACSPGAGRGGTAAPQSSVSSTAGGPRATTGAWAPVTAPEEVATEQALAVVPAYFAAVDRVAIDPTVPLETLRAVATSPQVDIDAKTYGKNRALGYRQTGTKRVVAARAVQADFPSGSDSAQTADPAVTIDACTDVSTVYVIDAHGKRVGAENRPNFYAERMTIRNPRYPAADGWRVSDITNHGVASCAGA